MPTKTALTLEAILDEKRTFDKSLKYSKEGELDGADSSWGESAPSVPHIVDDTPSNANLLSVLAGGLFHNGQLRSCIVASAADRKVSLISTNGPYKAIGPLPLTPVDSPVLDCLLLDQERIVIAAMSGLVSMHNLRTHKTSERRDHKKYVVKIASWHQGSTIWLATAGWDARVLLYKILGDSVDEPVAEISLQTNPETLLFAQDPDTSRLFLILSRRDSTSIYYHLVNTSAADASDTLSAASSILTPAGSQSLAPHSNAWIAFSPSSMALCPTDPTLLAVATSSLPHMKAIIVRLLFPSDTSITTESTYTTQAEQGRASLAKQDREEAAIQVHISTMAPQTAYSTPQVAWRPNGRGIWVNGDDGVIRGIEAKTGKVREVLKSGHEVGSKIRSIWAGWVEQEGDTQERQEWLISGGFDKRLIIWRSP